MPESPKTSTWCRTLGILGGLGPHAHLELERRLLKAVEPVESEADYPPYMLSCLPATPDRTRALLGDGPSPAEEMVRGLKALAPAADYAIIACITAHAFLDDVSPRVSLPILHLVEATLEEIVRRWGQSARVGVLGTTGTLRSGLFPKAAKRLAPGLRVVSPLDAADGERMQEEWVMTPIYGRRVGGRRRGGLKSGEKTDEAGVPHRDPLQRAALRLVEEGADVVITGCTEIGMAIGEDPDLAQVLLDPLDVAVRRAFAVSRGEEPLPG